MENDSNNNNDELEIVDLDYEVEEQDTSNLEEAPAQSEKSEALKGDSKVAEQDEDASIFIQELEESIKKKEEEIEKLRDRLLRSQADFENFRKRTQREIKEIQELASEGIIKELLPVFDNIERGLEAGADLGENDPHLKGLRIIRDQFWQILENQGIERIQALNAIFDPKLHLAANAIESTDYPGDTIIDEYQPGYKLKSKVIRPSMVVVSKIPRKTEKEQKDDSTD
ncbi:MAG: nucleotide exchange factor GrpE [Candidatus Hodarchaeota archaeon]